jgi:ribose transport system ATP-binding protein
MPVDRWRDDDKHDDAGPGSMGEVAYLHGITKRFGGVAALKGVDFTIRAGEVHALVGENGAGKSTLMRVLGGEIAPDAGEIQLAGVAVQLRGPRHALHHGIAIIHQELALAPDLTVAENIYLGVLPSTIAWKTLRRRAQQLITQLGFDIDPGKNLGELAVAHQQVVEIAKTLSRNARIIVFDEPTSVLATQDAERLLRIIDGLRQQGVGIVYISHRLDEVFRVADRLTVLKDGAVVGTVTPDSVSIDDVIRMMVGRSLSALFGERGETMRGEELLRVEHLSAGRRVRDVNFSLRAGEIVGFGGLVGAGRTEMARLVFGADRREAGRIVVQGRERHIRRPADAIAAGIALVPEDRKAQGVILNMPIRVNVTMARLRAVVNALGFIRRGEERRTVTRLSEALRIKAPSLDSAVSSLSGGNQQKVVLAKWFHVGARIILLDEPTRGVDVGTKSEIYSLIHRLAAEGRAVLVISSEHQELFGLCDSILVMGDGELRGELTPERYSKEALLSLAMARPGKGNRITN